MHRTSLDLVVIPRQFQHELDVIKFLFGRFIITQPAHLDAQVLRPFNALLEPSTIIIFCRELNVLDHQLVLFFACRVLIKEMMQAFIKSTALTGCWLIPFVSRLVMQSAALYFLRHRTALTSALDSYPKPKPSASQYPMGMALLRSR